MNQFSNGVEAGNGHGITKPFSSPKPTSAKPTVLPSPDGSPNQVSFLSGDGKLVVGILLRVDRHTVVFHLLNPAVTPKVSETIDPCKIALQEEVIYSGRAVVRSVVDDGITVTCEAILSEVSWLETAFRTGPADAERFHNDFKNLMQNWQRFHLIRIDYKVAIADLQAFLAELRLWLEQVELQIQTIPAQQRPQIEQEIEQALREPIVTALNNLFETFETVADQIDPDHEMAHRAFARHLLHPYWLGGPFMRRTYTKPLGYAGDYEMMNMIVRNGMEGDSLFARLINSYALSQAPCRAVRNRVDLLFNKIIVETSRVAGRGGRAKIFSIACGPAWEAVNFISGHPLARHAEFHLLDFNDETLRFTEKQITEAKRKGQSDAPVKFIRNTVQNLLRARRRTGTRPEHDLIYCSGLYDYLSDSVCKELNSYLHDLLKPGGLLVVGNFATNTPGQNQLEHLMDWHLIYRDGRQLLALGPEQALPDDCRVIVEESGANIFLEVRKPE